MNAAARDDDRAFCPHESVRGGRHLIDIGTNPPDPVKVGFEKCGRKVVRDPLHVLRQGKKRRSTIRRIQHGGDRGGQGLDELSGMRDSVPIASDWLERIVNRDGGVAEVFYLLKNGMR